MSLGATKGGTLAAEAVVVFSSAWRDTFDDGDRLDLARRRKRAGHELSKSRFVGAQLEVYFSDGVWRRSALHANCRAAELAQSCLEAAEQVSGLDAQLQHPVETNQVFLSIVRLLRGHMQLFCVDTAVSRED